MQIFYELPLPQTRHSMVSLTAGAILPQGWEKSVLVVWNMWGRSILTWSLILIHSFIYLLIFFLLTIVINVYLDKRTFFQASEKTGILQHGNFSSGRGRKNQGSWCFFLHLRWSLREVWGRWTFWIPMAWRGTSPFDHWSPSSPSPGATRKLVELFASGKTHHFEHFW